MPKESTIQHYTSSTTGSAPLAANLASGELAINTADEKVFYKNHNGVVLSLSQTKDLSGAFAASSRVVSSLNGLTGAVALTGDGGSSLVLGNNVITNRVATTSVTGVASFNSTRFTVSAAGAVDLAAAFQVTGQTVVSGGASQLVSTSGNTVTIDNRVATASLTGVASFSSTFFTVSATGSVQLAAAYQATGSGIATVPLATASLTGTASFNPNRFQVSATGNVDLLAAYQATGDTVITVAGSGIAISTSGKTDTLYNIGVTSFNGLTGNITLTGDGGSSLVLGNTVVTNRLASNSLTGVASFNSSYFTVSNGAVSLASAFQTTGDTVVEGTNIVVVTNGKSKTVSASFPIASASTTGVASFDGLIFNVDAQGKVGLNAAFSTTGDTIITVAGSGIGISTSGKTDTLYNIGVTSFNGLTGNITLTGDGGSSLVLGNSVVTNRVATSAVTGVASFNGTRFTVSAAGAVDLASAYQVTGDTVQAGSFINIGAGKTINNIGVQTLNGFTGAVQVTGSGAVLHSVSGTTTTLGARLSSTSVTGVASFNNVHFTVDTTGHVKLATAYQVTGQTIVSGGASQLVSTSGNTVTIDNRVATSSLTGVASFSSTFFTVSATGSVQLAAAYQATGSGISTVPLATTSLTGTASFNPNRFQVSATGNVDLLAAYQATGDTVITVAGSGISISTSGRTDTLYNIGVTSFNGLTGNITLTGDGGSSLVLGNTVVTNRLASNSLTGVASFNASRFSVTATGHVDIASGSITTALLNTSSWTFKDDAENTEGVQLGTSLTITGGPGVRVRRVTTDFVAVQGITASTSQIGIASFNNVHFTVDATGHVKLGSAYQVTGQTIVAGNNISTTTSGNTVTINVTAAGANTYVQFNSNGSLSANAGLQFDSSTENLRIGSGARHLELIPGIDNFVQAFGSSNLRLVHGSGNPITIGDFDGNYGGNNTYIQVDDSNSTIYMNAGSMTIDSSVSVGFGLSASSLYVSTGATFNSSLDVNGNATLGNAATDTTTIYGTKIINEGVYANGSLRTANISFANGQVQTLTGVGTGATGATAIYFTNPPSSGAASVTMIITNGGLMSGTGMTAWGGNIKWPAGIKPVLSSSGVDVVSFVTPDAGTTIYGFVGGLNFL